MTVAMPTGAADSASARRSRVISRMVASVDGRIVVDEGGGAPCRLALDGAERRPDDVLWLRDRVPPPGEPR